MTEARITASRNGRTIAHHTYTGACEADRCLETSRFINEWTNNNCEANNADTFKHYNLSGDEDGFWTMVDGKLIDA